MGAVASNSGLMLLLMAVIGAGIELPGSWWEAPLFHLAGAGVFLGLVLLGWPLRRGDPERAAVAAVYTAIADVIEAAPDADEERRRLPEVVNAAQDVLLRHRLSEQGRDVETRWLTTMLNAASPLLEAVSVVVRSGTGAPRGFGRAVRRVGDAVARGDQRCPESSFAGDPVFVDAVEYARKRLSGPRPEDPDLLGRPARWPVRVVDTTRETVFTWPAWRFGLRLALCIGIAAAAAEFLPVARSYWVPLTVTFILKPDFGSVFVRAILRGLGTLVGVAVAAAVLLLVPRGWAAVPLAAVFAGLVPVVSARSYAMQTAAVTPLILVLVDLTHHEGAGSLAVARLADTALGCLIVLVFGYALWPDSWRVRITATFADTVDSAARYLKQAFSGPDESRSQRRRGIHRTITGLRTQLQQTLAEPPPASVRAAAWFPAVVAVEQFVDGVTAASVKSRHGGDKPPEEALTAVADALHELATAVRSQRAADPLPELPRDGPLGDVTADLRTLHAALPTS